MNAPCNCHACHQLRFLAVPNCVPAHIRKVLIEEEAKDVEPTADEYKSAGDLSDFDVVLLLRALSAHTTPRK
jgi:hypothetical protein